MKKAFKLTVDYTEVRKTYVVNGTLIKGRVLSRYGTGEVLSEEGAYLFENIPFTQGWIYTAVEPNSSGTYPVLEKNIRGHKALYIEEDLIF